MENTFKGELTLHQIAILSSLVTGQYLQRKGVKDEEFDKFRKKFIKDMTEDELLELIRKLNEIIGA